jgi:hypothetical protein
MTQNSYALTVLLVPFICSYLLAPIAVRFGWTRRAFMRLCSWMLVALGVLAVIGNANRVGWHAVAWGAAFLTAAAIGLHLSDGRGHGLRVPRSARRMWRQCTSVLGPRRDPDELVVLCERRIGRPVDVASQFRVKTPAGPRTHVLAVAAGHVWWLELHPWRGTIGCILLYRPLDGLAAHSERVRPGRYQLELSWPASGELFVGRLDGTGADRLAGQLAAEQFARAGASAPARKEGR